MKTASWPVCQRTHAAAAGSSILCYVKLIYVLISPFHGVGNKAKFRCAAVTAL